MGVDGRLFEIVRLRGGGFQLAVNFDPQIITLFKEVRNMPWLNYVVGEKIIRSQITGDLGPDNFFKGMNIRWDHFVDQYDGIPALMEGIRGIFNSFENLLVCIYVDKTNNVIDLYKDILCVPWRTLRLVPIQLKHSLEGSKLPILLLAYFTRTYFSFCLP